MSIKSQVIVRLKGGLGNQMFQYAFGRKLANIQNKRLVLDTAFYNENRTRKFELNNFCIRNDDQLGAFKYSQKNLVLPQLLPSFIYHAKNYLKQRHVLLWRENERSPQHILYSWKKDIYLDGYWQGTAYFKDLEALLHKEFQPAQPLTLTSQQIKTQILSCKFPVSVHIRRGDYANDPKINSVHGLCTVDYYLKAIHIMQAHLHEPTFFLFTDDPAWVDKFIGSQISNSINISALYTDRLSYEDLILMSYCKHHIIANSTFSWWGAWLSSSCSNKLVITPKNWFTTDNPIDIGSLIPDNWMKI